MPQDYDDPDDLAALRFSGADQSDSDDYSGGESAALDFSGAHADSAESAVGELDTYEPAEPIDAGAELGAIHSAATQATEEEGKEIVAHLFTVTNPPETVSVSAAIDGRIERVDLSAQLTGMNEAQLTEEILVIADLARQKGLAGQHTYLLENALVPENMPENMEERADGRQSREALCEFMESGEYGMGLPSPERAATAQAEVFATRYATDE
jgi:hypothetical protein